MTYEKNLLVRGDNLALLKQLCEEGAEGRLSLIYVDPPFFAQKNFKGAYDDRGELGDFLEKLRERLILMRGLLSESGTICVHLDWHAVHYVKVLMDEIFGYENFANEIIWCYKSGGSTKKRFARKHDNILVYAKNAKKQFFNPLKEKSYNRKLKPYRFKGVKEYRDELGWYTLVNMRDVWEIDMVGRTSGERTGYATQKPEALLERIVSCYSAEGELCADFYGGSGTLPAVCENLGRRWIYCDIGENAFTCAKERLLKKSASFCEKSI